MRCLVASCIIAVVLLPGAAFAQTAASTDNIVTAARQAAQNQQYARAAALMRKAIEQDPARRAGLLREYADDVANSGDAQDAIPLYREILADASLSPGDLRAARRSLARALVDVNQRDAAAVQYRMLIGDDQRDTDARLDYAQLLWDRGDLGGARAQYCAVLAQDPRNAEARLDFARLESWRRRYHESKRLVLAYLQNHKNDSQSRVTLAQDELWMGRPDEAAAVASSLTLNDPSDAEAKALLAQTRDANAPRLQTSFESAKQSNNLLIQDGRLFADATPDSGRTSIAASFERVRYAATNQDAEIIVRRPGVQVVRHFSDWTQVMAEVSSDDISSQQDSTLGRSIGTYDAAFSASINDALAISVRTRKQTFDNLLSLALGISANYNSLRVAVTPDERTRGDLRLSRGIYSDGNRENLIELAFDRRVLGKPEVTIGANAVEADFSEQLANGYFNPLSYRAIEATGEIAGGLRRRLDYDIAASLGTERTRPGGSDIAYSVNASLTYRLGAVSAIELYYDAYNTYQQSSNGFTRHALGIELTNKL